MDLASGITSGALVISAETREDPADRDHRHAQETADARLRRWKDGVRFGLSALLLVAIAIFSARIVLDATSGAEEKAWARTVLFGLSTAVGGYFIGRKDKE